MRRSVAITLILVGCFLWACIGISSRALYDAGFSPFQVSATKSGVTALGVAIVLLLIDRTKFMVRKQDIWLILLLGLSKFTQDFLIFYGQAHISLSLTAMLQLTSPYYVLVFSAFIFRERITLGKVICMIIAAVGCVLATGVLAGGENNDVFGILAAATAGVAGGVFAMASKGTLNRGYAPETALFYMFAVGAVISLFFCDLPFMVETASNDLAVLGYMLLLGIVFTLIPHFMNLSAMNHMPITHVVIIGLSEIIFTALVGLVYFQEYLTPSNIVGMILIISSIVIMETVVAKNETAERINN